MPTNEIRFVFGADLLKNCWMQNLLFCQRNLKQIIAWLKYMYFRGASELQMDFWWISSYGWRVVNSFPVNFMFQRCWNRLRYVRGSCFKDFASFWKIAMKFEGFCKLVIFWAFVKDLETGHKFILKKNSKKTF